jgi:hypothetical protein
MDISEKRREIANKREGNKKGWRFQEMDCFADVLWSLFHEGCSLI